MDAAAKQPTPKGIGIPIVDLVVHDFEERAKMGEAKYGERLKAHNGRDALLDAYQEAIDLCMYLRQKIEENKWLPYTSGMKLPKGLYVLVDKNGMMEVDRFDPDPRVNWTRHITDKNIRWYYQLPSREV